MPVGYIKTERDRGYWNEARASMRESYPKVKKGSEKYYRIVMGIVKKRKGEK